MGYLNAILRKFLNKEKNKEEEDEKEDEWSIISVAFDCYEKADNAFDFSFAVLASLLFIYLTIGAFIYSHNKKQDFLIDNYYFNLMSLLKIGLGDLTISLKEASIAYLTLFYAYILVGISFFLLIIEHMKLKLKFILIKTGHNIIYELFKFANQLGYNIDLSGSVSDESIGIDNMSSTSALCGSFNETNKINITTVTNDVDIFYTSQVSQAGNRRKTPLLQKRKQFINGDCCVKCDKQTQITTLLCTKPMFTTSDCVGVVPIIKMNDELKVAIDAPTKLIYPNKLEPIDEPSFFLDCELPITTSSVLKKPSSISIENTSFIDSSSKPSTPVNRRRTRFEKIENINYLEDDSLNTSNNG